MTRTHLQSYTVEYRIWFHIKGRCYNPTDESYPRYGGRGIIMCERWKNSFEEFFKDVGLRPSPDYSIDRIDNDRGYFEDNWRWATSKQQNRNKRNLHIIEYNGERKTLIEWAEQYHIPYHTLSARINKLGWSIEEAFDKSLRKKRGHIIVYNDQEYNGVELSKKLKIPHRTLIGYINDGWDIDKILTKSKL